MPELQHFSERMNRSSAHICNIRSEATYNYCHGHRLNLEIKTSKNQKILLFFEIF